MMKNDVVSLLLGKLINDLLLLSNMVLRNKLIR